MLKLLTLMIFVIYRNRETVIANGIQTIKTLLKMKNEKIFNFIHLSEVHIKNLAIKYIYRIITII